jgi:hypothetical protein|nr:MAG TPA_asm: hypothetical protein [Caudoviricetes sp.]
MTDKQMIVDGVDVSEWTDEEVRYKFEKHSPKAIRQIAFDLYKQLKRKEQECEKLKREIAFGNNGELSDKIRAIVFKDLNAENSKYKQALDEIENYVRDNSDFDKSDKLTSNTGAYDILEIINEAKE